MCGLILENTFLLFTLDPVYRLRALIHQSYSLSPAALSNLLHPAG